ncbi:MAG: O-antigen ligase family protein [bacterium]|nr:O-antigen ligase family protein [bacterium]
MQRSFDASGLRWLLDARLFVLLVALTIGVIFLPSAVTLLFLVAVVGVVLSWRFPTAVFYIWMALAPLIGWTVFFSVPSLGGMFTESMELAVGELVAAVLVGTLLLKKTVAWIDHKKIEPWMFPVAGAFLLLVAAHVLSAFSPAHPSFPLIIKYSLRPVLWVYITSVVLPVNFIKDKRRLTHVLILLLAIGAFFALDGLRSLAYGSDDQTQLARAHPMPWFGVFPIGINHNVLAEYLSYLAPAALALSTLVRSRTARRLAYASAALSTLVAVLTFARSAWISLGCQVLFLCFTLWRPWIKRHVVYVIALVLALIPLAGYMTFFTLQSGVRSSTDSRAMLIGIAYDLWKGSPFLGVGAGTFVDRVAAVWLFNYEYGGPLDSHGLFQKVLAETGLIGIAALFYLLFVVGKRLTKGIQGIASNQDRATALYLVAGVIGAFVYQVFNTTYWTPHLWLPVGLALAWLFMLSPSQRGRWRGWEPSDKSSGRRGTRV